MTTHILVAHDAGAASRRALAWAADLARATGASLRVLTVMPLIPTALAPPPYPAGAPGPEDFENPVTKARAEVAKLRVAAPVEVVVAPDVAQEIVERAQSAGCDLIVMGTEGRGVIPRLVLGSVADFVVRHAHCPVVTMRAEAPV